EVGRGRRSRFLPPFSREERAYCMASLHDGKRSIPGGERSRSPRGGCITSGLSTTGRPQFARAAVRAWLKAADLENEGKTPVFRPVNRHSACASCWPELSFKGPGA